MLCFKSVIDKSTAVIVRFDDIKQELGFVRALEGFEADQAHVSAVKVPIFRIVTYRNSSKYFEIILVNSDLKWLIIADVENELHSHPKCRRLAQPTLA